MLALLLFTATSLLRNSLRLRGGNAPSVVVVGSLNVDTFVDVDRLPSRDETVGSRSPSTAVALGGKGANQAVAAARLSAAGGVAFVGQFGGDAHAAWLEQKLAASGVDVAACGRHAELQSGQGYVLLEPDGAASSVVVSGANGAWADAHVAAVCDLARGAAVVLLQREVPEGVNEAVAAACAAAGVPVLQDVGGEERPIADAHLANCAFVCPNLSELERRVVWEVEDEAEARFHADVGGEEDVERGGRRLEGTRS